MVTPKAKVSRRPAALAVANEPELNLAVPSSCKSIPKVLKLMVVKVPFEVYDIPFAKPSFI